MCHQTRDEKKSCKMEMFKQATKSCGRYYRNTKLQGLHENDLAERESLKKIQKTNSTCAQ